MEALSDKCFLTTTVLNDYKKKSVPHGPKFSCLYNECFQVRVYVRFAGSMDLTNGYTDLTLHSNCMTLYATLITFRM